MSCWVKCDIRGEKRRKAILSVGVGEEAVFGQCHNSRV